MPQPLHLYWEGLGDNLHPKQVKRPHNNKGDPVHMALRLLLLGAATRLSIYVTKLSLP